MIRPNLRKKIAVKRENRFSTVLKKRLTMTEKTWKSLNPVGSRPGLMYHCVRFMI